MTKILVTGSSGHIGSVVYKQLSKIEGYQVYPFDIKVSKAQDMLNPNAVAKAVKDMDIVIHLAAIPHPHKQFTGRDYFETNVVGTFNMIEASIAAGVKRFIYSSSTAYYGIAKGISEVKAPIDSEETLNYVQMTTPKDHFIPCWLYYGSSKVASEALLASYGYSKQIEMAILRFSPCPTSDSKIAGIVKNWGTYVHVLDASNAIEKVVAYPEKLWYERFNISTIGTDTSKARDFLGYDVIHEK